MCSVVQQQTWVQWELWREKIIGMQVREREPAPLNSSLMCQVNGEIVVYSTLCPEGELMYKSEQYEVVLYKNPSWIYRDVVISSFSPPYRIAVHCEGLLLDARLPRPDPAQLRPPHLRVHVGPLERQERHRLLDGWPRRRYQRQGRDSHSLNQAEYQISQPLKLRLLFHLFAVMHSPVKVFLEENSPDFDSIITAYTTASEQVLRTPV